MKERERERKQDRHVYIDRQREPVRKTEKLTDGQREEMNMQT